MGKSAGGCNGAHSMAERNYPMSEVRGSGQKKLTHAQGQGGSWKELPHARSQGLWPRRTTPYPRSGGCAGAGGPGGATPPSKLGGAAVKRYPLSKVRSSRCALLE